MRAVRRGGRGQCSVGALVLMLLVAAGCADHSREPPGAIVLRTEWVEPPPNEPISIGGYAFFGRLSGPGGPGPEFELTGEATSQVAAGSYLVDLWIRSQNDAIEMEEVPGGTPRMRRLFGPIEAVCSEEVVVPAGGEVRLVLRATVGHCEVILEP